jgi:hypothetical protein
MMITAAMSPTSPQFQSHKDGIGTGSPYTSWGICPTFQFSDPAVVTHPRVTEKPIARIVTLLEGKIKRSRILA